MMWRVIFWRSALLLGVSFPAYATQENVITDHSRKAPLEKPFRVGMMRFDPPLDVSRALAAGDLGGWLVHEDTLIGSLGQRWVVAWQMQSRSVKWWFDSTSELTTEPQVVGGHLIVAARGGELFKLDIATGKRLWRVDLDAYVDRPMVVNGNTLLALSAGQVMYGIDLQNGRKLWVTDLGFPDGLTLKGAAAPVIQEDRVLVGLASGEIAGVNTADGKVLWRYSPAYMDARFHDVLGELVSLSGKLLVARSDGLITLIDSSGRQRKSEWQEQLPSISTSFYREGKYFVGLVNGEIYALDASSGRKLWRYSTGQSISSMIVGESLLIATGAEGRVSALQVDSGELQWVDDIGSKVLTRSLVYKDFLLVPSGLKNIYAYKLTK